MLSKPMLKVFASSLVSLVRKSDEMRKEVKNFKINELSSFRKLFKFNFASYKVLILFIGKVPDNCTEYYEIRDRHTNNILISNFC